MMNAFSRREFGAVILFGCLLNGIVLLLFRVKLYTFHKSLSIDNSNSFNYAGSVSATPSWPLMILAAITIIGLWLPLAPSRKKLPPKTLHNLAEK